MSFPVLYLTWDDLDAMLDQRAHLVRTQGADPVVMARELIAGLKTHDHVDALGMIAIERRRKVIGVDDLPEEQQRAAGLAALAQTTPMLALIEQYGSEAEALVHLTVMEIADRAS